MYGLILAGGSGSRLWPMSRELYPKQLLKLNSERSLLEETFLRLGSFIPFENIISITNTKHSSDVRTQLNKIYPSTIVLSEPIAKNTAPAISVATKYITDKFQDDIILVLPSDHMIKDTEAFRKTVFEAEKLAQKGYIVTFGVKPKTPHTGYGYIRVNQTEEGLRVEEFKEKPDIKTAEEYFKSGNYFWNAGIFMFKASVFLRELKQYAPEISDNLQDFNFGKADVIEYTLFDKMPSISIDYALMEKTKNIALVPLRSDWSDLGDWDAIYQTSDKDELGNVKTGNTILENCKNSLVYSSQRLVAGIGLDNMAVIETPDAVLVCQKNETQNVKKVYEKLKEVKDSTHSVHLTVYRPWGYYTVLNQGDGYLTKMIHVNSNAQLSLQSHNFRSEHWVVLSGVARITLEDKVFMLKAGSSIDIPVGAKHSLANPYKDELKIIEVQKGDKLIEEDIIRYKDIYGRVQ